MIDYGLPGPGPGIINPPLYGFVVKLQVTGEYEAEKVALTLTNENSSVERFNVAILFTGNDTGSASGDGGS